MSVADHQFNAIDVCCGCGGLSLGLRRAGFHTCHAFDHNADALSTFSSHHPTTQMHHVDITDLAKRIDCYNVQTTIDLVCGGPPCEGFSGYNRFRSAGDSRNDRVSRFLDVVSVINPRAVLIENVVGILSSSEGEVPIRLLDALDRLGFSPSLHVLQAGGYGVPQNRWRVFFVGLRGGEARFYAPEPTHFFPRLPIGGGATKWRDAVIHPISPANGMLPVAKPPITVRDAIGDLPPLANGQSLPPTEFAVEPQTDYQKCLRDDSSLLNNHSTKRLGSLQIRRVHHIPKKPWSCWNDLPDELKPKHLVRQGAVAYDNRFGRLWNEDFFNTILTDAHLYWGRVIHPEDDRVISVRESARAQGIPDSVVFYGRLSSQYRQVGNAVPPRLAEAIGAKVVESFERSSVPTG